MPGRWWWIAGVVALAGCGGGFDAGDIESSFRADYGRYLAGADVNAHIESVKCIQDGSSHATCIVGVSDSERASEITFNLRIDRDSGRYIWAAKGSDTDSFGQIN